MDTRARHLTVDLWLDGPVTDERVERILDGVRRELTVLREVVHRFEPQGTTVVFVLSESHFALHTYPEADYLSIDVYVCNAAVDVEALADRLLAGLPIRHQVRQSLWRGVRTPSQVE